MKKYERIYNTLSKIYFVIHVLLFILIFVVSFLPFCEGFNFYQFFGSYLWIPFVLLAILLLAVWSSYRAIKRPLFSILVVLLVFAFFIAVLISVFTPALLVMTIEELLGGDASFPLAFNVGFEVMVVALRIIYLEIAFVIYGIIVAVLKRRDKRAANKAEKEFEVA